MLVVISPGRVAPPWARPSGPGTTRPIAVIVAGLLGVFILGHTVGECGALPGSVVRVLVPHTLGIQKPVQVCLVECGAEMGPLSDGNGDLGTTLAVPALGRLSVVVLLAIAGWTIITSMFQAVVPWRGTLGGVVLGLVPTMGLLGVFHVGMLVDDRHHVANGIGVYSAVEFQDGDLRTKSSMVTQRRRYLDRFGPRCA